MKTRHRYGVVAACVVVFALVPSMCAQQAGAPKHIGVPQDWSQHHIVFSRDGLAKHPELIYREPRVLHQAMQRWQVPNFGAFDAAEPLPTSVKKSGVHRDWNELLAGHLGSNMFPAKFSFEVDTAPDCVNDFVVFGLAVPGVDGGAANLVAFNNLYVNDAGTGVCPGIAPNVLFAYNITTVEGGRISLSPTLSLDGKKIGFVESVPTNVPLSITPRAIFHVLTWTAGEGTLIAAAAPTSETTSMTSLLFSPSFNSTRSSPWIDYGGDIVYLGADSGQVYQITGVFNGTPTLTVDDRWPVTLNAPSYRLTAPVLDSGLHLLMVGSANGNLYQIDTTTGTLGTPLPVGAVGFTNPGIVAPPIVDVTNGTTFVVSANNGISAVLVEADTASNLQRSFNGIGLGATTGTAIRLYEPAFSHDYFTDPSLPTAFVTLCGTGADDTSPWQYEFGFHAGRIMNEANVDGFPIQLSASTTDRCTGWTEFFNPNVGVSGTDFFFFGLTQDCTLLGSSGSTTGCVVALSTNAGTTTTTSATVTGGPSGIVIDNYRTEAEASNLYLTALLANTAYKFTQSGLR